MLSDLARCRIEDIAHTLQWVAKLELLPCTGNNQNMHAVSKQNATAYYIVPLRHTVQVGHIWFAVLS